MATEAVRTTGFLGQIGQTVANLRNPTRRGSSHRTELLAGLTTFVTMAYIIFVNTEIMAAAGLNRTALIIGTIFAAVVPTLFMGLWADLRGRWR
jgi:AGZA family xanthine/uracil permease-like MFS transporter